LDFLRFVVGSPWWTGERLLRLSGQVPSVLRPGSGLWFVVDEVVEVVEVVEV
jgi:hypothetical protein